MMPATAPRLDFLAQSHQYYLGERELPSVTTILKAQGLIDDRWFNEEARLRGEYVHLASHYLDDGDLAEETVHPDYLPYLQAYMRFVALMKPSWEYVEHRVYDETYGYAGTLDRAGVLSNGWRGVVDLKSGIVPPSVGPQTAAYKRCLPAPHTWKRMALQLKADGSFVIHELTDRRDEAIFLAALAVVNFKREQGIRS